jgi:predicted DNA binding CopG/RHH family protein
MNLNKLRTPKNKGILAEEDQPGNVKKQNMTASIMFRLTAEEEQKIKDLGQAQGLKKGTFVRSVLKKHGYI